MKNFLKFITILFSVITLSALMAHLLELRVKLQLTKEDYQIVQGIYRGWQWLGIFEIGTILFTFIWAITYRKAKNIFPYLLIALSCFIISSIIFFLYTLPANQVTMNWVRLPANWKELRTTWEYSQAVRAVLYFFGFNFLIVSILKRR